MQIELRRLILLLLLVCSAGCMQTENSSSTDASTYGGSAARSIIGSSCVPCHSYHTQTDAQLVSAGLVVAGDALSSKIYYRLTGSSGSGGPKNMPTGSTLTSSEIITIQEWIDGITP